LTEFINYNHFESQKPIGKPSVITWNGIRMIASHSIQAVAKELVNLSANQEMVSLNFCGKQSSGKSEAMKTLSHLVAHKYAKLPYQISWFDRHNIINLEETVKTLKPGVGHIVIFDDIGFLKADVSSVGISKIEKTLSIIRHLPGGEDIKIILMKGFQYTKAIPPFLRQNDMTFVSSVDDNEIESLTTLLGKKYLQKIKLLKKLRYDGASVGEFVYPMGGTKKVSYTWQKPFIPFLISTGSGCRFTMVPLRTWIDPICNGCSPLTKGETQNDPTDVKEFVKSFTERFNDGNVIRSAVKIKLIQQGINCFSPRIVQAVRYIEKMQKEKLVSIDAIAQELDVSPTKTTLYPTKEAQA
jgi:hypothetical protein